jgi:hypothetical protein
VQGRAITGENDLARKYITGRDKVPKIKGMMRRSLSGSVNG